MNVLIEKTGSIPANLCFTNWDDMLNRFVANMQGSIPGTGAFTIVSKDAPDASLRDHLWLRLDPMTGAPTITYRFYNGLWVAEHRVPPSSSSRILWAGTEGELETYDGGDANAPSELSGPMWEVDTDFAGRVPLAPGTLESTAVVGVGDTGGSEKVSLTEEELPPHRHRIGVSGGGTAGIVDDYFSSTDGALVQYRDDGDSTSIGYTRKVGGDQDVDNNPVVAHNNLPPYRGVYIIKRTTRRFYTVLI